MEILLLSQITDFSALASSSSVPYIDILINIASDFLEEVMRMRFRAVPIHIASISNSYTPGEG
jgi:hypothetical protein